MSDDNLIPQQISSPASTGQAGAAFEHHVDALFLALLLVRGYTPVLKNSVVEEVHLQTAHAGWATDDVLIVGRGEDGQTAKLALQVKRSRTISSSDEDCGATFSGFWRDFNDASRFNRQRDRLGLVVLHGTQALMQNLVPLLDCARAALDATDFNGRLAINGYLSKKSHSYCDAIRNICNRASGSNVAEDEFWRLLRILHILPYDLGTATSQTEALVKSLLAATTAAHDRLAIATASWNSLVKLAVESTGVAKSFRREELPEELRTNHPVLSSAAHEALAILGSHGQTVLKGIQDTIAKSVRLARVQVESHVSEALATNQVVIVSGSAGVGKSAVAKRVVDNLANDHFVFAFRAEEFAKPHLDTTLHEAGVAIPAEALRGLLSAQSRKLLLVESVERLLEHSTRDSFHDLLSQISQDAAFRILLTCRSYSLEIVRSSLIAPLGIPVAVTIVPELDDSEIDAVADQLPALKRPAQSPALRKLFRNPYVLDKAAIMAWPDGGTLPQDERSFRTKFWSDVVRKDVEIADAMPVKRERTFRGIAIRRARALTPYAPCNDLEPAIIDQLRRDDLVVHPEATTVLAAPAHDVLEDWALVHWIDEQFRLAQGDYHTFLAALDESPAIRRTYRRWLQELLECSSADADPFVRHVLISHATSAHLRDDTCVATLLAGSSVEFLARNDAILLANSCQLLVRMIHLLRIACVKTPEWFRASGQLSYFVPDGVAWEAMLRAVRNHLNRLLPDERLLLLGLVEDFSKSVAWWSPYPPGSVDAASIAHALLAHFEDYDCDKQRQAALEVIAKIPRAAPAQFLQLLELARHPDLDRRTAEDFAEVVLEGTNGLAAARDFPEELIALAEARFLLIEDDLRRGFGGHDTLGVDTAFGIDYRLHNDFFPASACRGIFLPLLRWRTEKGVEFLLRLFNHVADWYSNPRYRNRLEPAEEVEVALPDGAKVKQRCNDRFWRLYRGTTATPYVLQSALMALERYLLDICEESPNEVEPILLKLLAGSRNASVSAVIASVAIAHPRAAGRAGIALLTCRECILLDKVRQVTDPQASALVGGILSPSDHAVYDEERKTANAMPHRQSDLEILAINLQLGGQAETVQKIIDTHKANLPELVRQTDEDRQWRLALLRMDLRELTPKHVTLDGDQSTGATSRKAIAFVAEEVDEDIQQMIDQGEPVQQRFNADVALFNWAFGTFRREIIAEASDKTWKEKLLQAKSLLEEDNSDEAQLFLSYNSPRYAAAACARDHWDELSADDQAWCLGILNESISREADASGDHALMTKNAMDPSRPAAYCMALLLAKSLSFELKSVALNGLATALTHSNKEVIGFAAEGIGNHLWKGDRKLAIAVTAAMAKRANDIDRLLREDRKSEFAYRSGYFSIVHHVNQEIRTLICEQGAISLEEIETLNFRGEQTRFDTDVLLSLVREPGDEPVARRLFEKGVAALIHWWKLDRRTRRMSDRVPHEQLSTILRRLARYALQIPTGEAIQLCAPILEAVDDHYREVAKFVQSLVTAEDQLRTGENFWRLWQEVADRLKTAPWLNDLSSDHPGNDSMLSAIFFGLPWSKDSMHWPPLVGNAHRLDELALSLPAHHRVLDEYVMFLYYIGERSLPEAFKTIDAIVARADPKTLLSQSNTLFCLGRLLQRYVYGAPRVLKQDVSLRDSVLRLLDALVEAGSSAAYRMRDDFVTPMAG